MPIPHPPLKAPRPPAKVIHRGGRFDVLLRLGGGGMATVYLARALAGGGFERLVALKVLHPHLLSEPEFLVMFLDEARVAAKIHHPNVVAIHDLGTQDAWMYTVMDYVLGDTLAAAQRAAIKLGREMPLEIVLRITLDALRGLDAAHDLVDASGRHLHVVHRDVTPHNILLGVDGIARVTDFGIAKAEQRLTFTHLGMLKGKAPFMAPEQFQHRAVDRRADIFSMGITLWEALALRRCLPPDLQNGGARPPYRPLQAVLAGVPPALDRILQRALQPHPGDRWRTAGEFADAIEAQLRDLIAPHALVGSFVRAFAAHKIEAERAALRDASMRPPDEVLSGHSGLHPAPWALRGAARDEVADDPDDVPLTAAALDPPDAGDAPARGPAPGVRRRAVDRPPARTDRGARRPARTSPRRGRERERAPPEPLAPSRRRGLRPRRGRPRIAAPGRHPPRRVGRRGPPGPSRCA
ncbi:MAG: protein kinase [Polyangiales bacterium]